MSRVPMALVEPLSEEQIAALPLYEWEVAEVGDASPPLTYVVTPASILDYCAAVRNDNPIYADGSIAPPTYAFKCAPLRRNEVMHAKGYASPEEKGDRATPYAKSELFFQRPILAGDEITSVVRLEEKYERRGSQFMTWRCQAHDAHGGLVVAYTYTIIWRQAPRDPNAPPSPPPEAAPLVGEPLPTITKLESQEAIDRYAELTRIRPRRGQNLHTNPEFARRTIFGGTVNMGVATAAYCSEVLERAFGPHALLKPGARLEYKGIRPIRAGCEIEVGGVSHGDGRCELQVVKRDDRGLLGVATATVVL
jgi:acyl dehydratase